jgi:hypothetical protein
MDQEAGSVCVAGSLLSGDKAVVLVRGNLSPLVCVRPSLNFSPTRLCLVPEFGVTKFTVAFRLYLIIIIQPLTN